MKYTVIKKYKEMKKGEEKNVDKKYEPIGHINPEGTPIDAWPIEPAPGQKIDRQN